MKHIWTGPRALKAADFEIKPMEAFELTEAMKHPLRHAIESPRMNTVEQLKTKVNLVFGVGNCLALLRLKGISPVVPAQGADLAALKKMCIDLIDGKDITKPKPASKVDARRSVVAEMLAGGASVEEIAEATGVSVTTTKKDIAAVSADEEE